MNNLINKATQSRAACVLLAFALACSLIIGPFLLSSQKAYAATGNLSVGERIFYDNWSTRWYYADGQIAYCGNPSKASPSDGAYDKTTFTILGNGGSEYDYALAHAAMYYGYKGPGFEEAKTDGTWPATYYDGSSWTDEKYNAITHINLSDRYAYDYHAALQGCSSALKQWWAWNMTGIPAHNEEFDNGAVENGSSFYFKALYKWYALPQDEKTEFLKTVAILKTGTSTQNIITYGSETPQGSIDLKKQSSSTSLTGGNDCYSLAGAEYGIYISASDANANTNQVEILTTDATGYAKSDTLLIGDYFVKEIKPSEGYELDAEMYPVKVSANQTTRANNGIVYEKPGNDLPGALVAKKDAETGKFAPQGGASLAGAQFTFEYYDGYYQTAEAARASGNPIKTWIFKTDKSGLVFASKDYYIGGDSLFVDKSNRPTMPYGTYVFHETKAPEGYFLPEGSDLDTYVTRVLYTNDPAKNYVQREGDIWLNTENPGNSTTVQAEQVKRGGIKGQKLDSSLGSQAQGDSTFAGIKFQVINDNEYAVYRSEKTYAPGESVITLTSDSAGHFSTSSDALAFGKYILREASTNDSYLNTAKDIKFSVKENDVIVDLTKDAGFGSYNEIARGGVSIQKLDLETMLNTPLGAASVDGAKFAITTTSNQPIVVEDKTYKKGEVVKTITTRKGVAATSADTLPFGSYTISEIAPPTGYLITDQVQTFSIQEAGKIVKLEDSKALANQIIRGDLEGTKIEATTALRMANVPFEIKSRTTKEAHIIVTDENGQFSTHSSWNPHTQKTNANDTVTEENYDDTAGVWFGLAQDGSSAPINNALGALPYDTYTLTELPCKANEGHALVRFDVVVKRDKTTVDLGTINNEIIPQPEIGSSAKDARNNTQVSVAQDEVTVVDTINYINLIPGQEYTLTGILVDKATSEPLLINDEQVTGESVFTAKLPYGIVDVVFNFNAEGLGDTTIVVFEELSDGNFLLASHADIEDRGQTIEIIQPSITTSAKDAESTTQRALAKNEITLVDSVAYTNLIAGNEYTVTGVLMDKTTGEPLLVNDEHVIKEVTFVAEETSGSIDVHFTFDASELGGITVVVFEDLYEGNYLLASHADIEDEGQTIEILQPEISTSAKSAETDTRMTLAKSVVTIVDTVTYTNLMPGNEYTITGILMDKMTNEPLLVDNERVISEATFIAESKDGITEVVFNFNAKGLGTTTLVVFENLYEEDYLLASHADIEDKDQTIDIIQPEIGTSAKDAESDTRTAQAQDPITIIDTVTYKNLIEGNEYILAGILLDKATEEPLLVDDGWITDGTIFTAEEEPGSIDVLFTFDASGLGDTTVVVFEELYDKNELIAEHKDLDDKDQMVHIEGTEEPTPPEETPQTESSTPPPPSPDTPKTGDDAPPILLLLLATVILSGSLGGYGAYRRHKTAAIQN